MVWTDRKEKLGLIERKELNYFLRNNAAPIIAAVRAACWLAPIFWDAVIADCWKIGFTRVMMSIAAMITTIIMYNGDQSLPRFTYKTSM